MSEVKTVTPEELEQLKAIRNETDTFIIQLGQIQYQRVLLDLQQEQLKQNLLDAKQKESAFSDQLIDKYGNISVDIETGIIS